MLSEKEFYKLIAETIRNSRKQKGLTFEQLSGESEVDYSTLNSVENNRQNPKLYTLYKILYALDFDMAEFFKTKNKKRLSAEEQVFDKIRLLDSRQLAALGNLLDNYTILPK